MTPISLGLSTFIIHNVNYWFCTESSIKPIRNFVTATVASRYAVQPICSAKSEVERICIFNRYILLFLVFLFVVVLLNRDSSFSFKICVFEHHAICIDRQARRVQRMLLNPRSVTEAERRAFNEVWNVL